MLQLLVMLQEEQCDFDVINTFAQAPPWTETESKQLILPLALSFSHFAFPSPSVRLCRLFHLLFLFYCYLEIAARAKLPFPVFVLLSLTRYLGVTNSTFPFFFRKSCLLALCISEWRWDWWTIMPWNIYLYYQDKLEQNHCLKLVNVISAVNNQYNPVCERNQWLRTLFRFAWNLFKV